MGGSSSPLELATMVGERDVGAVFHLPGGRQYVLEHLIAEQGDPRSTVGQGPPRPMGVYAKVFAARDTHSGATVALKLMNKRGGKWFTTDRAFQNEVAAMNMCSDKGVVQCLARFHTNDDFVIVMPLATEDLFVFLRRHDGKLSEPQALGIWSKAVATVRSMHAAGVAHGDIKLENFYLFASSNGPDLQLGDTSTATRIETQKSS